MRKYLIVLLLLLTTLTSQAVTKRALVIGIGPYPKEGGWPAIHGDQDIPVVERYLLANGFKRQDIVELRNAQATRDGIKRGFGILLRYAQAGDIIYIHFSGHGQQVTDVSGDEEDGMDEAWVPYDAHLTYQAGVYTGQNHILDDQLNVWVNQLKQKVGQSGKVIVVADACHSGGGNRGDMDEDTTFVRRGTGDAFVIPGQRKAYNPSLANRPVDWIYLSACRPYESNYEYQGNGSLTYALESLSADLDHISCADLQKRIRAIVSRVIPFTQSPSVEVTNRNTSQTLF